MFNSNTTIKELFDNGKISVRTHNSLLIAGMRTLGDVFDYIVTPRDLLTVRNFGYKSYTEMEPILNAIIHNSIEPIPTKEDGVIDQSDEITRIIKEAYQMVTDGDEVIKKYLRATYPRPYDMHIYVMADVKNMLSVIEGYTRNENIEIRNTYKKFIDTVIKGMEDIRQVESNIYSEYKQKSMELAVSMDKFSYEQIVRNFLTPIAKNYLEKIYLNQTETQLSVRAQKFVKKFVPHFTDLIKYADAPLALYRSICPGKIMKKTLTELFDFNQIFKIDFNRVSKLTDDEIQMEYLKYDYPYLTNCQHLFVHNFIKKYGHAPMLFLLLQYLRLSKNRSYKIYCLHNGIYDDRKRTINEISYVMNFFFFFFIYILKKINL